MDFSTRLLIGIALLVAMVGAGDAALTAEWDLLALFGLVASLLLWIWSRQRVGRAEVSLRPDLARWISSRANANAEPFDDVLDRAVASFQHGLYSDDPSGG